jgi:hypothetical protein
MTRSGIAYRLPLLAPLTGETASGLLPTPLASNTKSVHLRSGGRPARSYLPTPMAADGSRGSLVFMRGNPTLKGAAETWPTPKASPSGPDYARMDRDGSGGDDLATAVTRTLLPTPQATDADRGGRGDLIQAVRGNPSPSGHFKTPTSAPFSHGGSGGNLHKQVAPSGGPLNPPWVAWLMGFPIDWTSLPPSETRSSRRSRNGSARASSNTRPA